MAMTPKNMNALHAALKRKQGSAYTDGMPTTPPPTPDHIAAAAGSTANMMQGEEADADEELPEVAAKGSMGADDDGQDADLSDVEDEDDAAMDEEPDGSMVNDRIVTMLEESYPNIFAKLSKAAQDEASASDPDGMELNTDSVAFSR